MIQPKPQKAQVIIFKQLIKNTDNLFHYLTQRYLLILNYLIKFHWFYSILLSRDC